MENDTNNVKKDNKNHITVGKLLEVLIGVVLVVMVVVFASLCTKANSKVTNLEKQVSELTVQNEDLTKIVNQYEERESEIKGIINPD